MGIDVTKLTDDELFTVKIQSEKELKRRNLKHTVGDIGELRVIQFFKETPKLPNLSKAPTGTKCVDALSRSGERYSIKTTKGARKSSTVYPDSENHNKQLFEYLLMVQLDADYQLESVHRFSWKQFLKVRCWDKRMSAWYVPKTGKALEQAEKLYGK